MAFKRLNDLRLVEEYCTKSENEKCPINQTCYDETINQSQSRKGESGDFPIPSLTGTAHR